MSPIEPRHVLCELQMRSVIFTGRHSKTHEDTGFSFCNPTILMIQSNYRLTLVPARKTTCSCD
ncbi:hypothetical protein BX600DRAFT_280565 [Xylariales sp. PMI_506]|nr:hypothetical protein BX600DRAFT_280565 [Xylariales sp. PMI_506]